MLLQKIFLIILLLISPSLLAQDIAIGQWRVHLPYNNGVSVASAGNKIYCATKTGVFTYNKTDNSIERLSKVTGLSDVDIAVVGYNSSSESVLIGYSNGNLDVIKGEKIINVGDIKRKEGIGNKSINSILMSGNLAYLSCGFGIIVLDMNRLEIKDTYRPASGTSSNAVNDVAINGGRIYAATNSGVYSADINNPVLADNNSWIRETISSVSNRKFNTICSFNGKVIVNFSSPEIDKDSMYVLNGSLWQRYSTTTNDVKKLKSFQNRYLGVVTNYNTSFSNTSGTSLGVVYDYNYPLPADVDIDENGIAWIADGNNGLIKSDNFFNSTIIVPNGPPNNHVFQMDISNNVIWVAPGAFDGSFNNVWFRDGIYYFKDNEWRSYNNGMFSQLDSAFDLVAIKVDPKDDDHVYAGGWFRGLFEFNDNNFSANYWKANSSLQNQALAPSYSWVGVGGMDIDADGNLWVSNASCSRPMSVKKKDGTWSSFALDGVSNTARLSKLTVASSGFKWINVRRFGLGVYNDNKTINDVTDDEFKMIRFPFFDNGEALQAADVIDFAEDLNGDVWMGTDKGIVVVYNAGNVFGADSVTTNRIKITIDGYTGFLLESEVVTAIAVDKANRKWIGTRNAGVFLVSADGTKQLEHFYTANSPLLSDNILCIAINHENGEVFFGTDKGILSYKSTATEAAVSCQDIYAYPNPVKPNYEGIIAIKGTYDNSTVKITDMAGNLVYETNSFGGQAIWNGKTVKGERVASGVYNVFATTKDGQKTCFTKILVIN